MITIIGQQKTRGPLTSLNTQHSPPHDQPLLVVLQQPMALYTTMATSGLWDRASSRSRITVPLRLPPTLSPAPQCSQRGTTKTTSRTGLSDICLVSEVSSSNRALSAIYTASNAEWQMNGKEFGRMGYWPTT
jgi:hypothetical protein